MDILPTQLHCTAKNCHRLLAFTPQHAFPFRECLRIAFYSVTPGCCQNTRDCISLAMTRAQITSLSLHFCTKRDCTCRSLPLSKVYLTQNSITGRERSNLLAIPLMLLASSVNTPIHNRFYLCLRIASHPVWIRPNPSIQIFPLPNTTPNPQSPPGEISDMRGNGNVNVFLLASPFNLSKSIGTARLYSTFVHCFSQPDLRTEQNQNAQGCQCVPSVQIPSLCNPY